MKRRSMLLTRSLLLAAMALGLTGIASVSAGEKCKDSMLRGLYVFTATGSTGVSPGPATPIAIIELIRFYGDGTADTVGGRVSVGGAVFPAASPGSYTPPTPVDIGCESVLAFSAPPNPSLYLFIPPDAKILQAMLITGSSVFQGPITKVSD